MTEEEERVIKIKKQAQQYYNESKIFETAFTSCKINWLCLISKRWLEKWMKYCDYNYIQNKNRHPEIYNSKPEKRLVLNPDLFPGEISNKDILIPMDSFVNTKDSEDLSTLVLRLDAKLNVDFTVISEKMWQILVEAYGGGPFIPKSIEKFNYYKSTIHSYSCCLNVLFIPSREIISKEIIDSMECHQFCFELPTSVIDIKELISYCLGHQNNDELSIKLVGKDRYQEPKIELYSNLHNLPISELKQLLITNINAIQEGKTIDINSVMGYVNDSIINTYLNSNAFILCEYFLTTSLFCHSSPNKDESNFQFNYSSNNHLNHHYNHFEVNLGNEIGNNYLDEDNRYENGNGNARRRNNDNRHFPPGMSSTHYDIKNKIKLDPNSNKNGIVGLANLGNTCYMNTSLQCLSSLSELSAYFLQDIYKNDLVSTNKSENNKFIDCYVDVIKGLWYGNQNSFPPSQFKSTIHLLNKMFYGFSQHDMHEFICFLLDTLHEGLNRANNKPNGTNGTNRIGNNNNDEDQLAKIEKSNQSKISDLIFGILRSTVLCPNELCNNISVLYEPYSTLSLPLTQDVIESIKVQCFMIFYDISILPIEFHIWINTTTTIDAFRIKVGDLFRIRRDSFLITKLDKDFQEINPETTYTIQSFINYSDKPLFLLQISPEVFHDSFDSINHLKTIYNEIKSNNKLLDKASSQEDSINGTGNVNGNDMLLMNKYDPMKSIDNKKWIKGVFHQYGYPTPKKDHEQGAIANNRLVFPRVIFINKEWTFVHLYNLLIDYFSVFYTQPKEVLFKDIETHLNKSVANMKSNNKRNPIPLPFIMLYEDTREKKAKSFFLEENWKDQIVPYDGSVQVLLNKKLPNIADYSQHVVLFKIAWVFEYEAKVKSLNDREKLVYIPSIRKKGGLDKCIEKFIMKEKLSEDNKWHCPKCNQAQLADKIIEIVKLPTYLILHLKRFNHLTKIDTTIDFPIKGLDMSHYVQLKEEDKDACIYDLVAVGNHSGGFNRGHYFAYAKNHKADQWFELNDSSVNKINETELVSSNAYVLFYKKRDQTIKLKK